MTHVLKEHVAMAKIRTRFSELLAEKEKRENRKIDRMVVVREAGIAYPTVTRWEGEESVSFDRFDSDTVIRLCLFFGCQLGELLYIDYEGEGR